MKSKYYTPRLEEFRIGFEYEVVAAPKDYADHHVRFTFPELRDIAGVSMMLDKCPKAIRVKYLDRSDIESCGFSPFIMRGFSDPIYYRIQTGKNWDGNEIRLRIRNDEDLVITKEFIDGTLTCFHGNIKNLSELKTILDMIGVEYES